MNDDRRDSLPSRRQFFRNAACAAVGTTAMMSTVWDLRMINAAAASLTADDGGYKALVCLFLFGGNDSNNLIVPTDAESYANYQTARANLAIPQANLLPLNPLVSDGRTWGIHPQCGELQNLFNTGKLAVLANVGTLVYPMTRQQYQSGTVPRPPQLFSHNDQQVQWQTSVPDLISRTGWGGRCADLVNSLNVNSTVSMSMSLAGTNVWEVGNQVSLYSVGTTGPIGLNTSISATRKQAIKDLIALPNENLFHKGFGSITKRALDNFDLLDDALNTAPPLNTPFPNPSTGLSRQMNMIARLINARVGLKHTRQIFFCSIGGYDTHGEQLNAHGNLLRELSQAMGAFYQATADMGIADRVTTFTASDFGRTYPSNGIGSDHGWGSHHLVMGGGVNGQKFYGAFPTLSINGPDDTSTGRWIPTTSVDEYSATLARWFGVSETNLNNVVFPNLGRFAKPDLGFMATPVIV